MPQSLTQQSIMSLKNGNTPMTDTDGVLRNLCWSPRIAVKTADYTVKSYETGSYFTTTGATAAVNFTLPTIASGPWIFTFVAGAAQNLTVTAQTADTMVTFNDLAADSIAASTSNEIIGAGFEAFTDGTTLFCVQKYGVSHRQTATIAT